MASSHDPWTFEKLFRYLKSPQAVVPGTKMSFAGLRSAQQRIDLLDWLRTKSDNPVAIPPPGQSKPEAAQQPAQNAPPKKQ